MHTFTIYGGKDDMLLRVVALSRNTDALNLGIADIYLSRGYDIHPDIRMLGSQLVILLSQSVVNNGPVLTLQGGIELVDMLFIRIYGKRRLVFSLDKESIASHIIWQSLESGNLDFLL